MPILHAYYNRDLSGLTMTDLCSVYTRCISQTLNAPVSQVRVLLTSQPSASASVGGSVGDAVCLLHIYLMVGRTEEHKAALIRVLTTETVRCIGMPAESVRVLFHELPKTDVGIGGATAVALGR